MKKKVCNLFLMVWVFALALTLNVRSVCAAETGTTPVNPTETTESTEVSVPVYKVTVAFRGNGGKGTMSAITVASNTATKLPANKFKRTGYTFTGWSVTADGTGDKYAGKADVTHLATASNDGQKITLYAQWKLKAPSIKSAKSSQPAQIKVTFAKNTSVSGFEIQYSTTKKFKAKSTMTVKAAKSDNSVGIRNVTPNKEYHIRMRSYKKSKGQTIYSDWSKIKSVKVKNGSTIANTKCIQAIEADVKLSGTGTGYHAKLVMASPESAVSFGMQFDEGAEGQYGGKNMVLIENISSNFSGGQSYSRPGNIALQLNTVYHLMMTHDGNGHVDVYVDYKKVGSCYQPGLTSMQFIRLEACARLSGDSVDAEFSNITFKWGAGKDGVKTLDNGKGALKWHAINLNKGLKYKYDKKKDSFRLYGTVWDVKGDWDSDYEGVSEIIQFD